MATKEKTKFNGKYTFEVPKVVLEVGFLGGEHGREVLQEYQGRVQKDFGNNKYLNALTQEGDGVVKGSNDFSVVLLNQILREEGLRTATPADLGEVVNKNTLDLRGNYEDVALVLRGTGGRNAYLAQHLQSQLDALASQNIPLMLPLNGLELVADTGSNYGLAFKVGEDTRFIEAPQLVSKNNVKMFTNTHMNGLPIFEKKGSRTLYASEEGLSRFNLGWYLDLNSSWSDLVDSDSYGRVVVVRGEATDAEFEAKVEKEIQSRRADLKSRSEKAMRILQGKE